MAIKLKRDNEVPPGGFRHFCKETTIWIYSPTYPDFLNDIRKHYKANDVAIPVDLEQFVQDQLCELLPPGWCERDGVPMDSVGIPNMTFQQVIQGTKTLVAFYMSGKQKVIPEEAARRTKICSSCQFNQPPQGCSSCNLNSLREIADKIVGGARVQGDEYLNSCSACGCSLRAKVWLPKDLLKKNEVAGVKYPEWCWMKD